MPVTHWPNCAFNRQCLPKEGNETSSSSHLHWNSNLLTLLVFERVKTRQTLNQQCWRIQPQGAAARSAQTSQAELSARQLTVNLASNNGQMEEKWRSKDAERNGGELIWKRFIFNSVLGEPVVMPQEWKLHWWMLLPLGTDINQVQGSFPKLEC